MTLGELTQLITALAAVGAFAISLHNSQKLREVHLQFNSRFDEWMKQAKVQSHAEGVLEEKSRKKLD